MKKFLPLLLATFIFSPSPSAEDFVCTDPAGCEARITRGGQLTSTTFRKGDMVSTEAGWVVSTDDGWKKIKTREEGAHEAPPVPQSHPWWWPIPCSVAGCHFVVDPRGPVFVGPIPHQIALIGL